MNAMNANVCRLEFTETPIPCPGGGERRLVLAFGSDGTMWLDPREFGIGPQHAAQLSRFGAGYLLIHPQTGGVLLNARAVVEVRTDPEWSRQWLELVEDLIKEHKQVCAQRESARNN